MLNVRWYKVLDDLWRHKLRTGLIVLSIAVGLLAVGTIVSARSILATEMARSYAAINPSSGTVRTLETFDEAFLRSVRAMPGVAEADARFSFMVRAQGGNGEWVNLNIFVAADYEAMRVNKIWPQAGAWPPPERTILIERAALPVVNKRIGESILLETPDRKLRTLSIAGTTHDLAQMPAQFDNTPYGYISFETLEWFGEPYGFNELHIVAENRTDPAAAQQVINAVKAKAEKNGFTIPLSLTAEPGQIPLDDILQAILYLMAALGMLALALSAFLIINTVSALLAQQRRQIGVMKAIGAQTHQIMAMYVVMILLYGVTALLIAVPLSSFGARALSRFMATLFNFDLTAAHISPQALGLQVLVGLLVPLLASLYPFVTNLRLTAAEAMSSYQTGRAGFGAGLIDRLLSGANLWLVRFVLTRPLLLSLRNTFRSKARLALTLITLVLASAIFVSVFNVRDSLFRTIDDLLASWNFDTMIIFNQPYRVERLQQEALAVPGVAQVDIQLQMPVRRVRPDESESGLIYLFARRASSELAISPTLVAGRWLLPGDEEALVVDTTFLQEEPDLQLGDTVVLKVAGRERTWRIVGVSQGFVVPIIYANYSHVARVTGQVDKADTLLIATAQSDPATVNQVTKALEEHFQQQGLRISALATLAGERAEAEVTYGILISLLLIMAVLLALVGGLGLMGSMSINVLERTREIGVLRAIGASSRGVAQVFVREGIAIGLLSWLLGALLALPLSQVICNTVGELIAGTPLSFAYSQIGLWLWLGIVVALSALASYLPARNAARLTVREVLAYE